MRTYINEHGTEVIDYTDERPVFEPVDYEKASNAAYEYAEAERIAVEAESGTSKPHYVLNWKMGKDVNAACSKSVAIYLLRHECTEENVERYLQRCVKLYKKAVERLLRMNNADVIKEGGWLFVMYKYKTKLGPVLFRMTQLALNGKLPVYKPRTIELDKKKRKDFMEEVVDQLIGPKKALEDLKGGHIS